MDPDAPSVRFEHVRAAAGTTVYVHGELDLDSQSRLRQALDDAVDGSRPVCVDLADVSFVDAAGIHALVDARRAAERRGARLVLVAPSAAVRRILPFWSDTDTFETRARRDGTASGAALRAHTNAEVAIGRRSPGPSS